MTPKYNSLKEAVEAALYSKFSYKEKLPQHKLIEAMEYSLLAGGKRLRPVLLLLFCEAAGGDISKAMPVACAVEMLHTYSLIHDDLPCMDNDDLRRGKPTNHKVFGECTATLAGDALQAEAFGSILRSELSAEVRAACAEALADAAGVDGICGGQQLDMEAQGKTLTEDELTFLQTGKTASLLVCACKMGALVANATEDQIDAACLYGASLGLAFQIRDDMLDELARESDLGKTVGSDKRVGKTTFMSLYGEEKCAKMVQNLSERAISEIKGAFTDVSELCALADKLCSRTN